MEAAEEASKPISRDLNPVSGSAAAFTAACVDVVWKPFDDEAWPESFAVE